MIQKLLEAAGQGPCVLEQFVFNELFDCYLSDLKELLRSDIDVWLSEPLAGRIIAVDRERLMVAFWSILDHAQKAMPDGGTITVSCAEVYVEAPEAYNTNAQPGLFATLTVRDEGPGLKKEALERLFEPFSSVEQKLHEGSGLSQAYGLMQRQGGWIRAESLPGAGADVVLYFPIEEKERRPDGKEV
jgi:signal transduction histidine kinase